MKTTNIWKENQTIVFLQQPFTRSNKLRTAVIKREQKNVGPRPKSVDFEVKIQSLSFITLTLLLLLFPISNHSDCLIFVLPPGVTIGGEHLSGPAAGLQCRGGGAGHSGKPTQGSKALTGTLPTFMSTTKSAISLTTLSTSCREQGQARMKHTSEQTVVYLERSLAFGRYKNEGKPKQGQRFWQNQSFLWKTWWKKKNIFLEMIRWAILPHCDKGGDWKLSWRNTIANLWEEIQLQTCEK